MRWPRNRTRNKYGAKSVDGFPSKLEAAVYHLLKLRERAGEISDVQRQQTVVLQEGPRDQRITYRVDFSYYCKNTRQTIWAEAKGVATDVWKMKVKMWRVHGPGLLEVYGGHHSRPTIKQRILSKKVNDDEVCSDDDV